ncbi:hypothetical protein D7B24_000838 [Verticillium nonalfalfae]|uniref:Signal recognition particle subunit SRP14 n=1 Tax=Verticillium nonalfalfae TaxID=1051616 RepID=A0A3M9Y4R6_9PEZI|nr:uncharacterized protein D7B24_000838 [Verticillium nonalfalfae]RNJ54170.1 hypothetical protein D7B24_000838 [Verticillium nonalfalfae]
MASHLSNDEFFAGLHELFNHRKGKDHGAIYLVQKRLTHGQDAVAAPTEEDPFPDTHPSKPLPIIVRATNAKSSRSDKKKVKLSTIVEPGAIDDFFARYAEVCKTGMTALKPRDKSKKKAKAKKRKVGAPAAP